MAEKASRKGDSQSSGKKKRGRTSTSIDERGQSSAKKNKHTRAFFEGTEPRTGPGSVFTSTNSPARGSPSKFTQGRNIVYSGSTSQFDPAHANTSSPWVKQASTEVLTLLQSEIQNELAVRFSNFSSDGQHD